jgi:hypothetical protein
MIDISLELTSADSLAQKSNWLDKNMPNAPLPEEQRWDLIEMPGRYATKWVLRFYNDHDATLYTLMWA